MHNSLYDLGIVKNDIIDRGLLSQVPPNVCTLALSKKLVPKTLVANHQLGSMCAHFDIINEQAHSALSDAVATTELLRRLIEIDPAVHDELASKAQSSSLVNQLQPSTFKSSPRLKGSKSLPVADGIVRRQGEQELLQIVKEIRSNSKVEYVNVTGDLTMEFEKFDLLLRGVGLYFKETPTTMKSAFLVVGGGKTGGTKIALAQKYRRPILVEEDAYKLIEMLRRS
jgi:hypothetical protein